MTHYPAGHGTRGLRITALAQHRSARSLLITRQCDREGTTYLDSLVRAACDEAGPGHVECRAEHACFSLERAGLRDIIHILERCPSVVVPERERPVVTCGGLRQRSVCSGNLAGHTSGEKDALRVDGESVDDGVVSTKVEDEGPLRALPLLDVVAASGCGCEGVLRRVDRQCTNGLLMVGQCDHSLPRGEIPQPMCIDQRLPTIGTKKVRTAQLSPYYP